MTDFIKRPTEAFETEIRWTVIVLWTLRVTLVLTIVAETVEGELLSAAEALVALLLCTLPGTLLRRERGPSPLDIEIVLLLIAVGNCTFGVAANFYRSLPYYDKVLHLANPVALAFYGLLLLADGGDSGLNKTAPVALVVLAVLAITGVSAIWELLEYGSDQFFGSTTQGSPTMAPLDDTMWDLLLSTLGALLGAIAATLTSPKGTRVSATGHRRQTNSGR